jgi:hypothetical protein
MSRINNQFSVSVHIMTALGDHHGEQVTSAHLTASVRAHESQVRTVLSKLVKAGLVVTSRGRNGFSSLSRPANKINLLEIPSPLHDARKRLRSSEFSFQNGFLFFLYIKGDRYEYSMTQEQPMSAKFDFRHRGVILV